MTDEEYLFRSYSKETKNIAQSAKKMNRTGKGNVKFPSDYLKPKEKKAMNGTVETFSFNKPVTWKVFKTWSPDIRKEYLENLRNRYGVGDYLVATMMGISQSVVFTERKKLGIPSSALGKLDSKGWTEFCNYSIVKDNKEDKTKVKSNTAKTNKDTVNNISSLNGSITFEGNVGNILMKAFEIIGNQNARVTINWETKN